MVMTVLSIIRNGETLFILLLNGPRTNTGCAAAVDKSTGTQIHPVDCPMRASFSPLVALKLLWALIDYTQALGAS